MTGGEGRITGQLCRIALVGCGAVSQLYYSPALDSMVADGSIELVGAFDPQRANAELVLRSHKKALIASDVAELLALGPDLVIIASPPAFHEAHVEAAMMAGANVLCEKPMTLSKASAERMAACASRLQKTLSVGLIRRQFPVVATIADVLSCGLLGRIKSVECFEGGPFQWPVASPSYFTQGVSGGGVLQDLGPHCLDLLTWWLGWPETIAGEDDAMGGIEANSKVTLNYADFSASVRLSRDWAQPNRYRIRGDRAYLDWEPTDAARCTIVWADGRPPTELQCGQADEHFHHHFVRQIRGCIAAGRGASSTVPTAQDVSPLVALIERLYTESLLMPMPWNDAPSLARAQSLRGQEH